MTAFVGSALYAEWVYATGTAVLSGDFRTLTINRTMEIVDATAGADTYREKLPSFGDSDVSLTMVMQADGTTLISALAQKTLGTINIGYEGTAAGKPKFSVAAYSQGPAFNQSYNDIVEMTCNFISTAAPVESAWS